MDITFSKIISEFRRFPVFIITGVTGFGVNLIVSFLLTEYASLWYMYSVVIGAIVSWTVVFFLNSYSTFRGHSREQYVVTYFKNMSVYLISAPIGFALVYALTSHVGIHYLASQILVVGTISVISFIVQKRYVFKYPPQP